MDLYVNPKGESRRWDKFSVLPTISSEIVLLKDLDKDGKPEVIFGQGAANGYAWAKPDPANPTAVWTARRISSPGQAVNGHGLGVGDVNGDGRDGRGRADRLVRAAGRRHRAPARGRSTKPSSATRASSAAAAARWACMTSTATGSTTSSRARRTTGA